MNRPFNITKERKLRRKAKIVVKNILMINIVKTIWQKIEIIINKFNFKFCVVSCSLNIL